MAAGLVPTVEHTLRSLFRGRRRGSSAASYPTDEQKMRLLSEVTIFCDLTRDEMEWLKKVTPMVTCEPGRVIYGQEDHAEALFILKRGRVQLYRLTSEGKKLEVATIEHGTFFGEMPLLGQRMHHTFAEALTECLICVMSRADIERLIARKPQVAIRMLEALGERLAETEARLEALAFQSVPARLAAALLRQAEGDTVRVTHQELADAIGAYRETVTKALDGFQDEGLVELSRMRIVVRDRLRLAQIAGTS